MQLTGDAFTFNFFSASAFSACAVNTKLVRNSTFKPVRMRNLGCAHKRRKFKHLQFHDNC